MWTSSTMWNMPSQTFDMWTLFIWTCAFVRLKSITYGSQKSQAKWRFSDQRQWAAPIHDSSRLATFNSIILIILLWDQSLQVLEKWPVDSAKKGKDLGEALRFKYHYIFDFKSIFMKSYNRTMFGKTYPQGSVSVVEDEKILNRWAFIQLLIQNWKNLSFKLK